VKNAKYQAVDMKRPPVSVVSAQLLPNNFQYSTLYLPCYSQIFSNVPLLFSCHTQIFLLLTVLKHPQSTLLAKSNM